MLPAHAINIHPMTHGMAANLMVFRRPIHSIRTPAKRQPTGTANTITDATHDDWVAVNFNSLSGPSTCGMRMAENASDIPITKWNEAAVTAANIWKNRIKGHWEHFQQLQLALWLMIRYLRESTLYCIILIAAERSTTDDDFPEGIVLFLVGCVVTVEQTIRNTCSKYYR